MSPEVRFKDVVIGQYADYLDTGMWSVNVKTGTLFPPDDLTPEQLRDFRRVFGELFPLNGR